MSYTGKYKDIIDLPHHRSKVHAHMSMKDRSAQFSPFVALTGHSEAIDETARITENEIELTDDEKNILDGKLNFIFQNLDKKESYSYTYFVPDDLKEGGRYETYEGIAVKADRYKGLIYFDDGKVISIHKLIQIDRIV